MSDKDLIVMNLKRLVKNSSKKIDDIADDAKISRAILYTYLNGTHAPSVFALKKLCKALDCTYECILGKIE